MTSSMESFIKGRECACCSKPAKGWEPRFAYFYCADHENTPPVDVPALKEQKATQNQLLYKVIAERNELLTQVRQQAEQIKELEFLQAQHIEKIDEQAAQIAQLEFSWAGCSQQLKDACAELEQDLQTTADALAEVEQIRLSLENVRLFAARHRKEDWAPLILGFCAEAGVVGSALR